MLNRRKISVGVKKGKTKKDQSLSFNNNKKKPSDLYDIHSSTVIEYRIRKSKKE